MLLVYVSHLITDACEYVERTVAREKNLDLGHNAMS